MTIKKRIIKACSLEVQFFGGWKALIVGSIPAIYWVVRRASNGHIGEIEALCLAYAFSALVVFIWQCLSAGKALEEETRHEAILSDLNKVERKQLQLLVNSGKIPVDQIVYDHIERKTRLIYRDMVGWWRIEDEHKTFLKSWARRYRE